MRETKPQAPVPPRQVGAAPMTPEAALRWALECLDRDGVASAVAALNTTGRAALIAKGGKR